MVGWIKLYPKPNGRRTTTNDDDYDGRLVDRYPYASKMDAQDTFGYYWNRIGRTVS